MADTRRLTPEMRIEQHMSMLDGELDINEIEALAQDALHDLDVADAEYKEAYQIIFKEMDRYKAEVLRCAKAEKELAAAQATIAVLDGSWCAENQAEGRNACGVCKNCLRATIAQQGVVIAAMREALSHNIAYQDESGYVCAICDGVSPSLLPSIENIKHKPTCIVVSTDTAQLASDHDVAVRAEERRKVLEEAAQIASYAFMDCDPDVQRIGDRIAAQIRILAAQPEEAGE